MEAEQEQHCPAAAKLCPRVLLSTTAMWRELAQLFRSIEK